MVVRPPGHAEISDLQRHGPREADQAQRAKGRELPKEVLFWRVVVVLNRRPMCGFCEKKNKANSMDLWGLRDGGNEDLLICFHGISW